MVGQAARAQLLHVPTLILDTNMGLSDYRLMLSRHLLVRLFQVETEKKLQLTPGGGD
jgi:hypothetical protein